MKKYKVMGSTDPAFMEIEMNIVFDDISIGKTCEVFGHAFTITQTGVCVVLSSETWVLTLLEISNPDDKKTWGHRLTDPKELRINHEVDVFLEPKEIRLTKTDRLHEAGITFEVLFLFLKNEWKFIEGISGVAFPIEFDPQTNHMTFQDSWGFKEGSEKLMFEGSFTRYNAEGRCV